MLKSIYFLLAPKKFIKSKHGRKLLRLWSINVRKRDKICSKCGTKKKLEAHHIYPKSIYPNLAFRLDNGVTLCKFCHRLNDNSYHSSYSRDNCNPSTLRSWLNG